MTEGCVAWTKFLEIIFDKFSFGCHWNWQSLLFAKRRGWRGREQDSVDVLKFGLCSEPFLPCRTKLNQPPFWKLRKACRKKRRGLKKTPTIRIISCNNTPFLVHPLPLLGSSPFAGSPFLFQSWDLETDGESDCCKIRLQSAHLLLKDV